MKPILINGRYLTQRMTGVQRYASEVVLALDQLLADGSLTDRIDVTLLVPNVPCKLPELRYIKLRQAGRWSGHLWEQAELPRLARGGLLFNPCGPSPLLHFCQVTMIPDASIFIAPQGYSFAYRTWTRLLYLSAGLRAQAVLTISNYSRKRLLESCVTLAPHKIHVVYPGCDHLFLGDPDESVLENLFGDAPRDYVLCVGSQQANKNVAIVASISEWLHEKGISTVITGGSSRAVFRVETIEEPTVLKTGYITDAQLQALYRGAKCFIFPSFEEGFGFPPLEAMRCNCPVISSSSACMPEVCGEAALYFNPKDADGLKLAIESLLSDSALVKSLQTQGIRQAEKYTWAKAGREIFLHLLREASR